MSRLGFSGSKISRRSLLGGAAAAAGGLPLLGTRTPAFAQSKVDIVSWCVAGPRFEPPQKALIALFQKRHPNIEVTVETSPWGEFYQKVAVALAGGATQYDTIMHDYSVLPAQAGAGWLTPLDPYIDADPDFKKSVWSDVPENVLKLWSYKGKQHGLPPDGNTQLMYWRSDILDKAGIKPPETWDDVIESAKELTGGGQYGFVCSLQRGIWDYSVFASILQSHGGQVYDPATFQVTLESEPAVKALNVLKTLLKYADPVTLNASNDDVIRSFASGRGVLAPCEWGGAGFTSPEFSKFATQTGAGKVPKGSGPDGKHVPVMGGLAFEIPVASEHKDEVWQWIKFIMSDDPEVQETWVKNSGQPTRLSTLKKYAKENVLFGALAESLPLARPFPDFPEGTELMDKVGTEVALVLTGSKAPEQAVKDMQTQVVEIFKTAGYLKG
jgi:multiple sugar transport system substrate-binding protein